MSWIAKNSVTGKTYGDKFECIYDCQSFIDNSLGLLEYEMRRAFSMEAEFIEEYELYKKELESDGSIEAIFGIRIQPAIRSFFNPLANNELLKMEIEKCFTRKKYQREIDKKIDKYVHVNWLKNNIIRCWCVEQKRFADGFDF